jgi:hypothetical protein
MIVFKLIMLVAVCVSGAAGAINLRLSSVHCWMPRNNLDSEGESTETLLIGIRHASIATASYDPHLKVVSIETERLIFDPRLRFFDQQRSSILEAN